MAKNTDLPIICQCAQCDEYRNSAKLSKRCRPKVHRVIRKVCIGPNDFKEMEFEEVSIPATVHELAHYFNVVALHRKVR